MSEDVETDIDIGNILRAGRWRVQSFVELQGREFAKELAERGYRIVMAPSISEGFAGLPEKHQPK